MRRPQPEKGAWNAQNVKFYQPAALTSFGVASFARQQRAGGPVSDPGSINVRAKPPCLSPGITVKLLRRVIVTQTGVRPCIPGPCSGTAAIPWHNVTYPESPACVYLYNKGAGALQRPVFSLLLTKHNDGAGLLHGPAGRLPQQRHAAAGEH